jgi:HPt (histidine-containing phosphotransfer) domain-containing protein
MHESPVIDPGAIQRLRKWGGIGLPRRMIEIFLMHSSERIVQIRQGIEREDAAGAEAGAHSLKSSAGNVGASRLQALCQAAEMLAKAADFVGLRGLVGEIEGAYQDARDELERILEGMDG